MSSRFLAKASTQGSYDAGKVAAGIGTIFGVTTTLLYSHDSTWRLYVEISGIDYTYFLAQLLDSNWTIEGRVFNYNDGDAFEADPMSFVSGKVFNG